MGKEEKITAAVQYLFFPHFLNFVFLSHVEWPSFACCSFCFPMGNFSILIDAMWYVLITW